MAIPQRLSAVVRQHHRCCSSHERIRIGQGSDQGLHHVLEIGFYQPDHADRKAADFHILIAQCFDETWDDLLVPGDDPQGLSSVQPNQGVGIGCHHCFEVRDRWLQIQTVVYGEPQLTEGFGGGSADAGIVVSESFDQQRDCLIAEIGDVGKW